MQKITPNLWFDKEAKAAAEFYATVFPDSKVNNVTTFTDSPSGDGEVVSFEVWGHQFMAISAGPIFKINPSISFFVNFDPSRMENAKEKLDEIWGKLIDGGTALMPLQKYDFSEHYGWVQDKFGVSWQLMLTNPDGEERPTIIPSLMFVHEVAGKAMEAEEFYTTVFRNSKLGMAVHYPEGWEPNTTEMVMFSDFMLEGQWFAAMDSAYEHDFRFNEAVSLMVKCKDQEEIDYYWEKLSAVPESEQCGWLKDRYGVSWQIIPVALEELLSSGTPEQSQAVTQAFLQMKKFDIAKLQEAYDTAAS